MKNSKLLFMLAATIAIATLCAETETVNGITWAYTISESDGYATIGVNRSRAVPESTSGAITIPSALGGHIVTSIGDNAFNGCSELTSVTIPNSVTDIGAGAFASCYSLTSATIPDSVTNIEDGAFYECGLLDVTIPRLVSRIKSYTFYGCLNLTNVTFETMILEAIEALAFSDCYSLSIALQLPDGLKSIGFDAFYGCDFSSVQIPNSVTSIWGTAFALQSDAPFDKTTIPGVELLDGWVVYGIPSELSGDLDLTGIRGICEDAFHYSRNLTGVTIPDNITRIGQMTFSRCDRLARVTIPDSVKDIGFEAFAYSGLGDVTIPSSVTDIGEAAFRECVGLTNVTFLGDAPQMGDDVFQGVDSNCVAYVKEYSLGWGVNIPGIWNGIRIEYLKASIPEVASNAAPEAVTNAIASAGFAPSVAETLQDAIGGDAAKYNEFRDWAQAVKDGEGEAAGEAAVVASANAAVSWLLGSDTLIAKDIVSDDVHITGFSIDDGAENGEGEIQFSFEVAIDGVEIGSSGAIALASLKENLRKAIGIEGATSLDGEFSSENIELTFDAPVDGKARFTVTPPPDAGTSFFMRAKVK